MRMSVGRGLLLTLLAVMALWPTRSPAQGCAQAIAAAEAAARIPDAFLGAIARVESGRPDSATGATIPWPWTVNAQGQGRFYATKAEAIQAVQALQASGVRSIDVGCLQINLMHHPDAFASLDRAFDPMANASAAASLLVLLFQQTGSWPHAAAAYHSQTPTIGADYQKKVLAEWAVPAGGDAAARRAAAPQPKPTVREGAAESTAPRSWAAGPVTGFTPPAGRPATGQSGRDLAAYRSVPVPLAWKMPRTAG